MMKTNEIRIGDKVLVDSTPVELIGINKNMVFTDTDGGLVAIEEVFPIPINEERLEERGFRMMDTGVYIMGDTANDYLMVRKDMDESYAVTLLSKKGVGGFNLRYMHEVEHMLTDYKICD